MNNLSLYKVINPKPCHKDLLNCIGITSMVSITDTNNRITLKFRTGVGSKFNKPFVADEFDIVEIEPVINESIEQFWINDRFVCDILP